MPRPLSEIVPVRLEHLFDCAICEQPVRDYLHIRGRRRQVAPVCLRCMHDYGSREPQHGSFMDRRKAVQISALAEALMAKANSKQWEDRHGRP